MSKKIRQFSKSKIYHIIIKGIDSQDIFYDNTDRIIFKEKLLETKKIFNWYIYAYCLMSNHIHLVISVENPSLSKSVQSLTLKYVSYFNKRYQRTGHLVQNRFNSKNVEDLRYFIDVCRYVHRNPENAEIAKTEQYEWSSYREYVSISSIVDTHILLHYFNNDLNSFINFTTTNTATAKKNYDDLANFAEYELIANLNDSDVSKIIIKIFNLNSVVDIPLFFKSQSQEDLQKSIQKIKTIHGTTKTQIARIIRIDKRRIKKFWK